MSLLQTILAFAVALALLIVVHEYGHYLAARWCGVKVLRFSVGFGKPLITRTLGPDRTQWILAAIPFGGYVKMLDEREGPVAPHELDRAFNRQSPLRRILIVIAGPLFNFLFAIALYTALNMNGVPEARAILAEPGPGTPAAAAGLHAGDVVRSIDGSPVGSWQEVRWRVLRAALQREQLNFEIEDAKRHISSTVLDLREVGTENLENGLFERIGMRLYRPPLDPVLGQLVPDGAAVKAGLKEGDRLTHATGKPIDTWEALVRVVRASPGTTIRLGVERAGRRFNADVVPESVSSGGEQVGRIGAAPVVPPSYAASLTTVVRYGPIDSFVKALDRTWEISVFTLRMMGKMLVGEVSWRHLSGPVTIADFAGQSAQLGWIAYATFLALISISLGVLNLLPIPLLDGGHLMYYAVEIIKGSPVSERAMEVGQRLGLALLLVMMAFAFYNDINRLFAG